MTDADTRERERVLRILDHYSRYVPGDHTPEQVVADIREAIVTGFDPADGGEVSR